MENTSSPSQFTKMCPFETLRVPSVIGCQRGDSEGALCLFACLRHTQFPGNWRAPWWGEQRITQAWQHCSGNLTSLMKTGRETKRRRRSGGKKKKRQEARGAARKLSDGFQKPVPPHIKRPRRWFSWDGESTQWPPTEMTVDGGTSTAFAWAQRHLEIDWTSLSMSNWWVRWGVTRTS